MIEGISAVTLGTHEMRGLNALGLSYLLYGSTQMNLWTGIAMLALAAFLIWVGRPNKEGVHPRFLRFSAATVLYPPVVVIFLIFGFAAIIFSPK